MTSEAELRRKNRTAHVTTGVTIGSGNGSQIGDDIPDGKVRQVWHILISNPGAAQQQVGVYNGDAGDNQRSTLYLIDVRNDGVPAEIGGNINNPIATLRPNTGVAPTQLNQLLAAHETDACDLTVNYYDE